MVTNKITMSPSHNKQLLLRNRQASAAGNNIVMRSIRSNFPQTSWIKVRQLKRKERRGNSTRHEMMNGVEITRLGDIALDIGLMVETICLCFLQYFIPYLDRTVFRLNL
ncbi:hypothetical protein ACMFMF_000593 [Clarireedia jacksonii]